MKILVINGSPRGNDSNTIKISNYFLEGIKRVKEVEVKEIDLSKANIRSCSGCFGCWKGEKKSCVINDDMTNYIKDYLDAELVIWATPLYHFTMTSLMKKFIERTLPVSSPLMIKTKGEYTHPIRYEQLKKQKKVLISTCGFPEYHNFDMLREELEPMIGRQDEEIFCVMGELLKQKELENSLGWYFEAVKDAGEQFALNSTIEKSTKDILKRPLIDIESFVGLANLSWGDSVVLDENEKPLGRGHKYLSQMSYLFNKNNNLGLVIKIAFEFTDTDENLYFDIKGNKVQLINEKIDSYDTKIITSFENWKKIGSGEINGEQALMDGVYRIDGKLSIMSKFEKLFGNEKSEAIVNNENMEKVYYGIKAKNWMGFAFIPWTVSWLGIAKYPIHSTALALLLSLVLLFMKKRVKDVTYFEKMNGLYFIGIFIFGTFFKESLIQYGGIIHFFGLSAIWGISIFDKLTLTADYSRHYEEEDLVGNPLFDMTNEFLTFFWAAIFMVQGILELFIMNNNIPYGFIYIMIISISAGKFTKFFVDWYPNYLAQGGKVKFRII